MRNGNKPIIVKAFTFNNKEVNMPPHHKPHFGNRIGAMSIGFVAASLVAGAAGLALKSVGIPLTVILPTLAPIWIGITTLTFMILVK